MNMIATAAAAAVATPTDAPALPAVKPQIEALDDNKLLALADEYLPCGNTEMP
jgi:hypothetical protein